MAWRDGEDQVGLRTLSQPQTLEDVQVQARARQVSVIFQVTCRWTDA